MRHDTEPIIIALPPERRAVGKSGRESYQAPRPCKLTEEQEAELRRMALGRSLRALAAEFGVSHETIRTMPRENSACSLSPSSTPQHYNPPELAEVAQIRQ